MSSTTSTTTSATATPTASQAPSGGGGPTSSPLLFFVALGFGVVFTNLWIIVGVKYCFRYNQRNRQRRLGEDGNPIDLGLVPRPQRRRREKKLMTMDEVNERFPLTKYKAWRAQRAVDGLPTEGGVTAPPSRAASLKDVEGVTTTEQGEGAAEDSAGPVVNTLELAQADHAAISPVGDVRDGAQSPKPDDKDNETPAVVDPLAPAAATGPEGTATPAATNPETQEKTTTTTAAPARRSTSDDESDAEDDPIRAPAPPELLSMPGDTCAICIDNLEDDDDVRGLSCGHAFHAACVDPWLTSRRACCPLCKADYYVPKPRNPADGEADPAGGVQQPGVVYLGGRAGGMPFNRITGHRFFMYEGPIRAGGAHGRRPRPFQTGSRAAQASPRPEGEQAEQQEQRGGLLWNWRRRGQQQPGRGGASGAAEQAQETTPATLEAGDAPQPANVSTPAVEQQQQETRSRWALPRWRSRA